MNKHRHTFKGISFEMEDMAAAGTAAQMCSSDQSFTNCVSSPYLDNQQAAVLSLWSQSTQHHPQTKLTGVLKAPLRPAWPFCDAGPQQRGGFTPESHSPPRHLQAVVVT